jgi:hypothetical protein
MIWLQPQSIEVKRGYGSLAYSRFIGFKFLSWPWIKYSAEVKNHPLQHSIAPREGAGPRHLKDANNCVGTYPDARNVHQRGTGIVSQERVQRSSSKGHQIYPTKTYSPAVKQRDRRSIMPRTPSTP